jgi:F0F1-type ATP synthase delta subunit
MKISRTKLAAVIAGRVKEPVDVKALASEIAAYLLVTGRSGELGSIMRDVMQIRAEQGTVEVIASDAHQIAATIHSDIETIVRDIYPNASDVIISEAVDPALIGGIRLELANQLLDLSVEAKLDRFKQLTSTAGGA